jgi:hypothetical protein
VQADTAIRGHFVALSDPKQQEGWKPWIGGTWSKWVCGKILGYKDFAGGEAQASVISTGLLIFVKLIFENVFLSLGPMMLFSFIFLSSSNTGIEWWADNR